MARQRCADRRAGGRKETEVFKSLEKTRQQITVGVISMLSVSKAAKGKVHAFSQSKRKWMQTRVYA